MGGLFSSKTPKPPKMPEPPEPSRPVRMPTLSDPDVEEAARRTRSEALRRRGRRSTILTDYQPLG